MNRSHQPIKNFTIDEILQKVSEAGSDRNNGREDNQDGQSKDNSLLETIESDRSLLVTIQSDGHNRPGCGEPSWKSTEDSYTISTDRQISGCGIYNNLHGDKRVLTETTENGPDIFVALQHKRADAGNEVQPDVQPCTSTDSTKVKIIFKILSP